MKKFNDVKLGDRIFIINVGKSMYIKEDQYGNIYNDGKIDRSVEVLSVQKTDNKIFFNPIIEHGSIKSCLLSLSINDYSKSSIQLKQNSYPYEDLVFFSDENECIELQKTYALKEIKKQEQSIIDHQNSCIENIKSIRERYYKVLNNMC